MNQSIDSNLRQNILNTLQLISSLDKQMEYENNVPIANVPAELICLWFDDDYQPDSDLFKESFTDTELRVLKEFNDFYAVRLTSLCEIHSIQELHQSAVWIEIANKACLVMSEIKDGSARF